MTLVSCCRSTDDVVALNFSDSKRRREEEGNQADEQQAMKSMHRHNVPVSMNVVLKQEALFEDAQRRFHPNTLAQQHWSIPLNPCRCKSVSDRKAGGQKLTMTFSQLQRQSVFLGRASLPTHVSVFLS
jgi:hypothetical protein